MYYLLDILFSPFFFTEERSKIICGNQQQATDVVLRHS